MRGDFEHIFRAFVKDEPHKKAKAELNRWRLIICCSLAVQMVWRMCFGDLNKSLCDKALCIPSCHGVTLRAGDCKVFRRFIVDRGLRICRDIQGWDVNSPGWVFDVALELRERLTDGATDEWRRIATALYADAYSSAVIRFSNGFVYQQEFSGFMKSGLYSTISDNSFAMTALHIAACHQVGDPFGYFIAVGDDTMQSFISEEYLAALEKLGCRNKEVEYGFKFIGRDFEGSGPVPLYVKKHLFALPTKREYVPDVLDAYMQEYAHSEYRHIWRAVARKLGIPLRSDNYYRFLYDHPDAREVAG
jgi:hypothetical protein